MKSLFSAVFVMFFLLANCQISERKLIAVTNGFLNRFLSYQAGIKQIIPIVKKDTLAYVVQLSPRGYLVITPNEKLTPVLAFSTENDFDFEHSEDNILLDIIVTDMTNQLALMKNTNDAKLISNFKLNTRRWLQLQHAKSTENRADEKYGPILSSVWGGVNCKNQDSTYIYVGNYYTPNHYSPGCVSTSMAMILHYYRWPRTGLGSHTDNDNSGSSQGSYFADFGATTYDWCNMLDKYHYKVSDTLERAAMGLISYHYGIAADMDYEYNGSTSNISKSPDVLNNYFRYTGHYNTKSWGSFWSRMYENLQDAHPVQLSIYSTTGAGHAPTVDGYWSSDTLSDIFYHLNMGWWGSWNNWYALQGSFNASGYSIVDAAVFDILPDPEIEQIDIQHSDTFTIRWKMPSNIQCDTFELQRNISGIWTTITKTLAKQYKDTVSQCGNYQYRVRARIDGNWYFNNYSEVCNVFVDGDITSLNFDGDDSFFVNEKNDHLDVTGNDWTIETWVYPTEVPASSSYPAIISRKYSFELYFRNESGGLGVGILAFDGTSSGFTIEASLTSGTNTLSLNEWHHIAASKNGTTTRLFIDGIIVGSSTDVDFDLDASVSAVNLGARYAGSYERYIQNCKLDEIRYSKIGRYISNFSPKKYDYFSPDAEDIFIFHLDEGTEREIFDDTGYFTNVKLRIDPNDPEWSCDAEYKGYYVDAINGADSNPGTQLQPWKTINKVNNATFNPGDHIHFKRGCTWNEFLYIENKQGTEHAHIVFESYDTGNKPIIDNNFGVIVNGSSFIKIKNFDIKGDYGILIKDDSYANPPEGIHLNDNIIHDESQNASTGAGIYLSHGANNISILNNEVFKHSVGIWIGKDNNIPAGTNNIVSANTIYDNEQNGIGISSSDCSIGNETILSSNKIYNNGFHGIELSGRYYIVENNEVYNNGQNPQGGASGIHTYSRAAHEGESEDRGGDHNVIRNNLVYNTLDHTGVRTDGNGIQMDMWCDSNLIYNNVVYGNDGAGIIVYGGSGNEIYNNTMYDNGQDLGIRFGQFELTVLAAQLSGSNGNGYLHSSNNRIKNNIAMAVGTENTRYAASICDISMLDDNLFENNIWYNESGTNNTGIVDLINHTVEVKTMVEWNNYLWTTEEISANPLFVNATNKDFSLDHNSPAIDFGQDLTVKGIIEDYHFKKRPLLGEYDAGAYEHGIYWTGAYSSEWNEELNWHGEVLPAFDSCVTIFSGYNYFPVILQNNTIKKLYLHQNANLKIMPEKELNIEP